MNITVQKYGLGVRKSCIPEKIQTFFVTLALPNLLGTRK